MGPVASKNVAILQGNATVAHLMREYLQDSAFDVEFLSGTPPGAARAHVVVIDIDSGVKAAAQWIRHCDGRQLPLVLCGVEHSRDAYLDRPWLSRPFTSDQLVSICREVIKGKGHSGDAEQIPPPIQVDADPKAQPTLEIAAEVPAKAAASSGPQRHKKTARQTPEELLDVLHLDASGSMILEIEDLSEGERAGGMLVGGGARRDLEAKDLAGENPWSDEPDTAVDLKREDGPTATSSIHAGLEEKPAASSNRAEVTAVSSFGDVASGDFSSAHRVASLVAEHWDCLGLTARPADRADRLQRVLSAMFHDGMDGVLDELKRIPRLQGFSGSLQTLSVVDLLHTIGDRRLRGRLEVGLNGHAFVLYVDGRTLHDIDSLGENTDGLLIEILHESGAINDKTYRHYDQLRGKLRGEPLEMKLKRDKIVDESQLLTAKKRRATRLLDRSCRGERGTFAFIEVSHQSGQAWPTQGLNLNIEALLLQILRENPIDDSRGRPSSTSDLVIDSERASRLSSETLTESEQRLLEFFEDGHSIDKAREMLSGSDESMDRALERLKRLELLRRLGAGEEAEEGTEKESSTDLSDVQEKPTAVSSSWSLQVLDEIAESTESQGRSELVGAGPTEETQEDVGFSAGVPEDFTPDEKFRHNRRRNSGRDSQNDPSEDL